MIGAISVRVTAGHPEAPLRPVAVIQGSAMTVEVVDAPRSGNGIAVSGVSVTVTNANGVYTTAAAIRTGSVWTATIPATAFAVSGNVDDGLAVVANGKDENGVSRSWNIGRGQLTIISAEAVPTPSTPFQNVKILTTQPTTPILGDMFYFAGDGWKIYNGSSWDDIGGRDGAKGDKGDKGDTGAAGRDGVNGVTPTIGDNGDWFIGTTDTGKPSRGEKGEKGDKGDTGSVESVAFSDITNKPTTLAGYGITDAALSADVPTAVSQLSDADDYLKKSGGTMTGDLFMGFPEGGSEPSKIRLFQDGGANDTYVTTDYISYFGKSMFFRNDTSGTLALTSDIKTKTSELTNDSGFVTADEVSAPDAHLEVSNENLKVIGENDSTLWQSAGAVRYTKATTEAVALLDMTVNPYTLSAASGTTFSMPSASVAGKIRDFILDITNPLSSEATIQLAGDETTYKFVGVGGVSVTDCLKFAAGESAIVSFTERAIAVNGKVSFVVSKRVVA